MNVTVHARESVDVDHSIGSPQALMKLAEEGRLPKSILVTLLDFEYRRAFLEACAAIEKSYTEECTAANDPCLESGCAAEGEICLQPLLRAGIEYHRACAAEWIKVFADPRKRIDAWKH
jgi:hypothetical protein